MAKSVNRQIMLTVGAYPPETGGILLGPIGSDEITAYYFDHDARCSGATYSPNHVTLSRKMKEEWLPTGLDMKGFVHSHPSGVDRLSAGDLEYIGRLLGKTPTWRPSRRRSSCPESSVSVRSSFFAAIGQGPGEQS